MLTDGLRRTRRRRGAARAVVLPLLVLPLLVLAAVLVGLTGSGVGLASPQPARAAWAVPSPGSGPVFTIDDPRLEESSGLTTSNRHRGIMYTVNDSGPAQIYALDRNGDVVATLLMRLVQNIDWEAVAAGPQDRIWVADIGDNAGTRPTVTLYRFREPATLTDQRLYWSRFQLQYDDGPHDAEAILVQPRTGRVYVVTKGTGGGGIYAAPSQLSAGYPNTLRRVADAPARITDGAFLPDGSGVVLRSYLKAYVLDWPSARVRRTIGLPLQPQGESLAVSRDGKRILVGSEGRASQVFAVSLAPPRRAPTRTPSPTPSITVPSSPTPSETATPSLLVPGGSEDSPHALVAGLPWWVPAAVLGIALAAGVAAFPRRRR